MFGLSSTRGQWRQRHSRPGGRDKELFEAFHAALGQLRRGVHTDKLAELLLRRDQKAAVVALVDGGERVVVFEESERRIVAEQFDAHGFSGLEVL